MAEPLLGVVGRGLLADAIRERLGKAAVVIVASDGWDTDGYPAVRASGASWLPVRTELGRVVLGPLEVPGEAGCVACAAYRRRLARDHLDAYDALVGRLAGRPSSWLTPLACETVATLAADEALRASTRTSRTRNALLIVNLADLSVSRHAFLPDPRCPVCGSLDPDPGEDGFLSLSPRPKPTTDVYRLHAVTTDEMRARYVDPEVGIVHRLEKGHLGGLVTTRAVIGLPGSSTPEAGYGRSRDYPTSETTAVLEALERWGGWRPGRTLSAVRAPYHDLRGHALDPASLGLYPPDRYRLPGFAFHPFDPARDYWWVWCFSFGRQAPILVPQSYAYYGTTGEEIFVQETSNGCAVGSCLEEAILYGLLEVAERDAFLMTWYARLAAPRVAVRSAHDRSIPMLAAAIEGDTGATVLIFDSTLEHGVPCVWAMAVNRGAHADGPAVVCAAGSHLDPEQAVAGALRELGPTACLLARKYRRERAPARRLVEDSSLVSAMADHSLLYADPLALPRLDFLLTPGTERTFAESFAADRPRIRHADLTDDLTTLIGRYLDTGLDVIVVDQTTAEHRAGGVRCVKVIVPGALPMTFGHRYRRVDGLPRLAAVRNEHPHPFP